VEGKRNQVANQRFGSIVGFPGVAGISLGGARRTEVDIVKTRFGSALWGGLRSRREQHSTVDRRGQKASAGYGPQARVHQHCYE